MVGPESEDTFSQRDDRQIKQRLQRMDDYDFEYFIADLWEQQGWNCEVSQASSDAGIDVTATKSIPYNQKSLIQAKRYGPNTTVGGPEIQQYASLKNQQQDADSVVVITSNAFTKSAKERARDLNVKIIDGDELEDLVKDLGAEDILERYDDQVVDNTNNGAYSNSIDVEITEENGDSDLREGDGSFSPDSSPDWLYDLEQSKPWHELVVAGIGVLLVTRFLEVSFQGIFNPISTLFGYMFSLVVVGIGVAWYLDMRYVRNKIEWSPTGPKYIGLSFILGPLPLCYYYYKRYGTIGL